MKDDIHKTKIMKRSKELKDAAAEERSEISSEPAVVTETAPQNQGAEKKEGSEDQSQDWDAGKNPDGPIGSIARMSLWKKVTLVALVLLCIFVFYKLVFDKKAPKKIPPSAPAAKNEMKVKIMASGDILYHSALYKSAYNGKTYDFSGQFAKIKPLISSADLALGDFEGTINPNRRLSGYPTFNAPKEVVAAIADAGYDVIDLAHNHILDTGLEGLKSTDRLFTQAGITVVGVQTGKDDIVVKKVKGIKIAIVAYVFGFNGLEATISKEDYEKYMKDLNEEKVKRDIEKAEKIADVTVVMPQMGEEYRLEPTEKQKAMYRKMIDWGADIIFGGHPHVAEPTEVINKNGQKKFILYSMGNLISNQRLETLNNKWTERGVIMEVNIEKKKGKTVIESVKAHPTWVSKTLKASGTQGGGTYDYQVFLAEDYIKGGKSEKEVDATTQKRIENAYHEMIKLLNIDSSLQKKEK